MAFALLSALYSAMSVQQYRRMFSHAFDLGFFEAIVRDYAHGRWPVLPLTDTTVAALHFSPALAVLAPVVLLVPSPLTMLVAQAVLVGSGVIPLMRVAGGGAAAWATAVAYGLAPGFASLIRFDFHEVALAVPLVAWSMAAMVRRDHRAAVLWMLPVVLVKEDLCLTLAALGFVVLLRGSRLWGLVAMVVGVVSFLLLVAVVLPAMQGDTGGFAAKYAPSSLSDGWRILGEGADVKVQTVLYLLIGTGLVALRSPMLLLVALPTFGWRFLSDRVSYWYPLFQYDAVLVPIAVAAMVEGLRLCRPPLLRPAAVLLVLAGVAWLLPRFAFSETWQQGFWDPQPRSSVADAVLAKIPDDVRVAASDDLGQRLALRTELYLVGDTVGDDGPPLPPSRFSEVDWVALDTRFQSYAVPAWRGFDQLLGSGGFEVVAEADGIVVARRVAAR